MFNPSNWKQEMSETKNSEHEPNSNLLPVLWRRNKVKPLVKTNLKEKKKKNPHKFNKFESLKK